MNEIRDTIFISHRTTDSAVTDGQYNGLFMLMPHRDRILEEGFQFFYVVDKRVQMEGKQLKPTLTNFRTLESFLEKEEPDELEFIKTGVRRYSQTDYADIDV